MVPGQRRTDREIRITHQLQAAFGNSSHNGPPTAVEEINKGGRRAGSPDRTDHRGQPVQRNPVTIVPGTKWLRSSAVASDAPRGSPGLSGGKNPDGSPSSTNQRSPRPAIRFPRLLQATSRADCSPTSPNEPSRPARWPILSPMSPRPTASGLAGSLKAFRAGGNVVIGRSTPTRDKDFPGAVDGDQGGLAGRHLRSQLLHRSPDSSSLRRRQLGIVIPIFGGDGWEKTLS